MLCQRCNSEMPGGDAFCEECGSPLANDAVALPPTREADHSGLPPCARCGASASAADEEGYCTECGFRREKPREHTEIVIDPGFAGVTDQGKRHAHNEDSMAVAEHEGVKILIVCDGVSSSQDAAAASGSAAREALASLQQSAASEPAEQRLQAAARAAWHGVAQLPYTMSEGDPPSTTFVAALVEGNRITVAWAGDSRAYWLAGEHSRQLTVDDSWLNDTVAEGKLSYEEALHSDKAHAITKWLGADAGEPEPSVVSVECPEPGVLLVCTDGLWNYQEDLTKIEELAGPHDNGAIEMARRLVDFANAEGGRDNITAAVYVHTPIIKVEADSQPSPGHQEAAPGGDPSNSGAPEPAPVPELVPDAVEAPAPEAVEAQAEAAAAVEPAVKRRRFSFAALWPLPSFQKGT